MHMRSVLIEIPIWHIAIDGILWHQLLQWQGRFALFYASLLVHQQPRAQELRQQLLSAAG